MLARVISRCHQFQRRPESCVRLLGGVVGSGVCLEFISGCGSLKKIVVSIVSFAVSLLGVVWWVSFLCRTYRESV